MKVFSICFFLWCVLSHSASIDAARPDVSLLGRFYLFDPRRKRHLSRFECCRIDIPTTSLRDLNAENAMETVFY